MHGVLQLKTVKLIGLVSLLLLLIPLASALSKPIAGRTNIIGAEIKLSVETDSPLGKQVCMINPTVKTGADGSFSTNLYNLVLKDFPSIECSNYWKAGDPIWYELNHQGISHISVKEQIESGTGLQRLSELNIPLAMPAGSSGGSGGGSVSQSDTLLTPSPQAEENIFSFISIKKEEELLRVEASLSSGKKVSLRVVVFSLPEKKIIYTAEDKITDTKTYTINLKEFKQGRYKVQAFVYSGEELIDVSNSQEFFISREAPSQIVMPNVSLQAVEDSNRQDLTLPLIFYGISFMLIMTTITLFILSKK